LASDIFVELNSFVAGSKFVVAGLNPCTLRPNSFASGSRVESEPGEVEAVLGEVE
jgi:hypothetical protein